MQVFSVTMLRSVFSLLFDRTNLFFIVNKHLNFGWHININSMFDAHVSSSHKIRHSTAIWFHFPSFSLIWKLTMMILCVYAVSYIGKPHSSRFGKEDKIDLHCIRRTGNNSRLPSPYLQISQHVAVTLVLEMEEI